MIAAKNAGDANRRLTLPKLPYTPPPVNPREMPGWYDRFYREHGMWVDQVNQMLVGSTQTPSSLT